MIPSSVSRPRSYRHQVVTIEYFQALEEAVFDLTDAKEAEKAKKEKRSPLDLYLKKRWGKTTI